MALKLTSKGKVYEEKFYNIVINEYNFDIRDGRHIKASFVLGFKSKKIASDLLNKKDDVLKELKTFFSNYSFEMVNDTNGLFFLRLDVLKALNVANYPVEYVFYNTNPKLD